MLATVTHDAKAARDNRTDGRHDPANGTNELLLLDRLPS
jgi:hypothetical protein